MHKKICEAMLWIILSLFRKKLLNRPNKYIQDTDCRLGFDIGDATNSWFYKSQNDIISRPPVTSDGLLNQSYACFYPPFFH